MSTFPKRPRLVGIGRLGLLITSTPSRLPASCPPMANMPRFIWNLDGVTPQRGAVGRKQNIISPEPDNVSSPSTGLAPRTKLSGLDSPITAFRGWEEEASSQEAAVPKTTVPESTAEASVHSSAAVAKTSPPEVKLPEEVVTDISSIAALIASTKAHVAKGKEISSSLEVRELVDQEAKMEAAAEEAMAAAETVAEEQAEEVATAAQEAADMALLATLIASAKAHVAKGKAISSSLEVRELVDQEAKMEAAADEATTTVVNKAVKSQVARDICMHTHTHALAHARTHTHTHAHARTHVHTCMCIHAYMHTDLPRDGGRGAVVEPTDRVDRSAAWDGVHASPLPAGLRVACACCSSANRTTHGAA